MPALTKVECRELILMSVKDLVANLLYYDRKEDEELSVDDIADAILEKEITVDEIIDEFRKELEDYHNTKETQ